MTRTTSANAPPNAGLQVRLATNELDRVPRNMHPSLAFENIRAAARGDNQQQQNPANPPAQQNTGGHVERKEGSFDPRSIGARQARDGHWCVPDQSRLRKYLTPTPGMRRWRWPGLLAAAGRLDQRLRRARTTGHLRGRLSRCLGIYRGAGPSPINPWPVAIDRHFTCSRLPKTVPRAEGPGTVPRSVKDLGAVRGR